MNSRISSDFRRHLEQLPRDLQRVAEEKFLLWKDEPLHPSLRFKKVKPGIWSVRISRSYRALGERQGDGVDWFWIGPHAEYDKILDRLP